MRVCGFFYEIYLAISAFMAWFSVSFTFAALKLSFAPHARNYVLRHPLCLLGCHIPFSCFFHFLSNEVTLSFNEGGFYHMVSTFWITSISFYFGSTLPPVTHFQQPRVILDLDHHHCTLYSRVVILETSNLVVVCYINNMFYKLVRPILMKLVSDW